MTIETFGIVGFGHFGEFLAESFKPYGQVLVTDVDRGKLPQYANGVRAADLAETAAADVVVLAVTFNALERVLGDLSPLVPTETVIMDVVSTKARATGLLQHMVRSHENVIATHPLFGPPSMESVAGQSLVVTFERGERTKVFRRFLEADLKLRTLNFSAEEHDRQMAYMQALPFFIARALAELNIPELAQASLLSIPSFEKLATIASIERHHSQAMFETSQTSNPYAREAREHLLSVLRRLNDDLTTLSEEFDTGAGEWASSPVPAPLLSES
jgi:prephenate dehydrogenase